MSELPRLMLALAEDARQIGCSEDITLRLQLITEELFTNTVTHGHGSGNDTAVTCRVTPHPSGILLRYADAAPAYDLTRAPEQTASEAVIGGLGIALVRGLSQDVRYARQDGLNVCEILI